jgi:hypothetical protein
MQRTTSDGHRDLLAKQLTFQVCISVVFSSAVMVILLT